MKRKFGTRVKWFRENYWVSRGLPPPRGVSLRGNGGHEFFFFFFFWIPRNVQFRYAVGNERFEFLHFWFLDRNFLISNVSLSFQRDRALNRLDSRKKSEKNIS